MLFRMLFHRFPLFRVKGEGMKFLKRLIGLADRPEELHDGMLEELVGEERKPLVVEFYSNT